MARPAYLRRAISLSREELRTGKSGQTGLEFALKEALDPLEYSGQVYPLRVGDTGAVAVGHKGIDSQNGIRAAQQIGASRVAKACAALALRRVGSQLEKHIADAVITGAQLRRRVVTRQSTEPDRLPAADCPLLHAIPDNIRLRTHSKRVYKARFRQCGKLGHRRRSIQHHDAHIGRVKADQARSAADTEVWVCI